jgi:hypothetical protein
VRLAARNTQRLTNQLRLALEPECLENRTATARENTQRWSGLAQRHSSCLWFQIFGVEAHSSLPYDQYDRGSPALCEMTALRAWLKERRRSNDPSDFVFVSKKGGSLGQRQVNRLFADYCELASQARMARGEVPIAISVRHVHCLKHSRGTSLAERGVNPYRIKLILGHKSMSSTERYLHGSQKQAWAEAQRFSMEVF